MEQVHLIIAVIAASVAAVGGLIGGVWRVSRIEQGIRDDFKKDIADVENEARDRVIAAEARCAADIKAAGGIFDETLKGLRQKINDVELEMVRGFVSKPDFDEFRKEYREDMRDLKASIASIARNRQ